MPTKILIPLDGSESTQEVLYYTHSIATSRPEARVTLLHVLPGDADVVFEEAEMHPCLKPLSDLLSAKGWQVDSLLRHGSPVAAITSLAKDISASLIVMSTHGRSGLERIREGSVTEAVLRDSICPVFVLHSLRRELLDKRADRLFQRLLVPLDGSEDSAAILPCVQTFAKAHDAEVVLFHDSREGTETSDDERGAALTRVRTMMEEQSVKLANAGLKVKVDSTSYRHSIQEILDKIDNLGIDLVVMATHTKPELRHALEESVTADVVRHANCPLMVWSSAHCREVTE
ncbi:MAG: universal stress protein [Pseudomonadota bacterium]|nr:universal stress protein [Pseudomonadota bacterium]